MTIHPADGRPQTTADLRALMAAVWSDAAACPVVSRLDDPGHRAPPGYTAWSVEAADHDQRHPLEPMRSIVLTPTLRADAPLSIRRRMLARVMAAGTGRCPLCSAVASVGRSTAGQGELAMTHTVGCPAEIHPADRRHFEPPTGPAEPVPTPDLMTDQEIAAHRRTSAADPTPDVAADVTEPPEETNA